MERFRAHEKEFKKKQFSKKALLTTGQDRRDGGDNSDSDSDINYGSDDNSNGDNYDDEDNNEENGDDSEEMSEELANQQKIKDKEYLGEVLDFFK